MEIWKEIPGYGGHYEASNLGRIKSKARIIERKNFAGNIKKFSYRERVLNPVESSGYAVVHLGVDGRKFNLRVHRAVLMAFSGMPNSEQEACHNNGNALDNRIENLRWDSHANNNRDRRIHGTLPVGEKHGMAKFSPELIDAIKNGRVTERESGVSHTHFWRIKTGKSWIHGYSEIDLLAIVQERIGL